MKQAASGEAKYSVNTSELGRAFKLRHSHSNLVEYLTPTAKLIAGLYFDLFIKQFRTDGLTFDVPNSETSLALRGRLASGTYELAERELIKRHLPSSSTVLELGGCLGIVSCLVNSLLDEPERHVVVEANRKVIPALNRNKLMNEAKFRIENCAISDATRLKIDTSGDLNGSRVGEVGAEIVGQSISKLEQKYSLKFDTLIADIEGSEREFFQQNARYINCLNTIIIEMHPSTIGENGVEEIREVMASSGLRKVDRMLAVEVWVRS